MKFIQATQRGGNRIGLLYRVTNGNYFSMANWMDQKLVNCDPNREETEYMGYIPATIGGKQNPVMRLVKEARERGMLIDASYGRSTRAVLIMDSDHVVLSSLQPETVANRAAGQESRTTAEEEQSHGE